MSMGLRERLEDLANDAPRADAIPPDLLPRARRRIVVRTAAVAAIVLLLVGVAAGVVRQVERGSSMPAHHVTHDVFADIRGKILIAVGSDVLAIDPSDPQTQTSAPLPSGWSPIAWSPDGQHILSRIWTHRGADLGVMNADGTMERLGIADGGSFSPDGSSVVAEGWHGLHIIQLDTHETRTLVPRPKPTGEAMLGSAWAPDGSTIVFIDRLWLGHGRSRYTIQAVSPDGSDRRILRDLPSHPYGIIEGPAWSPDGTRLCFVLGIGKEDGTIFVMNADGGNLRQLTDRRDQGWFPTWSPDGTQIAFVRGDHLMVMAADGSAQRPIGPGGWFPVWTAPAPG
jgi:WD40 repeat protein